MPEEKAEEETTAAETATASETVSETASAASETETPAAPSTPNSGRVNPLSRPGDFTERPGFRSASNKRSKATRKRKKRR
jgi:hypothetical protein